MSAPQKHPEPRPKLLPGRGPAASSRAVDEAARAHDLLAMVSHDFRNALNAVQLTARALQCHGTLVHDDYVRSSAHNVARVTARLGRLAGDLTDCALLREGRITVLAEPFTPHQVVGAVLAELEPVAARKEMRLRAELPRRAGVAHGDCDRLIQVLLNLGGNALKFAPRRTEVQLSAHLEPRALRFSVRDEGPGVPASMREQVFSPSIHAKPVDGGGAGLGLAIARTLVEAMGGTIWLEDTSGPGATFSFRIPLGGPGRARAASATKNAPASRPSRTRRT